MEKFIKKDKYIYYEIIRTDKKKDYYVINTKDGVAYISVPEYATYKDIKLVLNQQFLNLYYKANPNEGAMVHYQGKQYKLSYTLCSKDEVIIKEDLIKIKAVKNTTRYLKSVLYKFFTKVVEQEIERLIDDAKKDFKEVVIPKIIVKTQKGCLGCYCGDHIVISPLIAKYDVKYIKVLLYHEICHSLVKGHRENFWTLLNCKLKDGEKLNKEYKSIDYSKDYL